MLGASTFTLAEDTPPARRGLRALARACDRVLWWRSAAAACDHELVARDGDAHELEALRNFGVASDAVTLPPLAHPERVAAASIRGYLYQTVGIAIRWLALQPNELLLCEGDEDAEQFVLDEDGHVRDVTQVQFKDIASTLSARDGDIKDTVINFMRAYALHDAEGRRIRFIFTTSARRARQQVNVADDRGKHAVELPVDVLKTWMALATGASSSAREPLIASLRALAAASKPVAAIDGKSTKADLEYAEVERAVAYLDADASRWGTFMEAVEWQFEQGTLAQLTGKLQALVAADTRTQAVLARTFADQLIVTVLQTSARSETRLRTLDRSALQKLVDGAAAELDARASKDAVMLRTYCEGLESRLDSLEERIDVHDSRLTALASADRQKLLRSSARHFSELRTFWGIRIGEQTVRIERAVTRAIAHAALLRSVLVVGEPGAGKSGALADVATELEERGHDVVVVSADATQTMGDELVDLLQMWEGDKVGIVIIDALDSVRNDERAAVLRRTLVDIERISGRWRVVASIRSFDLYQGSSIARLFAGKPPTGFSDPRFPSVRHVHIGDLTSVEIGQLEVSAQPLFAIVTNAPATLATLLRRPFHLMLAAELLDSGTAPADIVLVRTRVGLLDLYWRHRVADHAPSTAARESLVRTVCARMLERRDLHVTHEGLNPDRLYELLTVGLFRHAVGPSETHDEFIVFGHHVLFDYAVASFWVPRDAHALAARLSAEPDLILFIRPSLEIAFQRSWAQDATRSKFWDGILALCGDVTARGLAKLIGPGVAAVEAKDWQDVSPLAIALVDPDPVRQLAADDALAHVVGALEPRPHGERHSYDLGLGPWAQLAEVAAGVDRFAPRELARRLLRRLTARVSEFSDVQLQAAGRAARSLFAAAMSTDAPQRWLLPDAIAFVCRTQPSDPGATASLLLSLFTHESLKESRHVYVPRLAREIRHLFSDPSLVQAIYAAAFAYVEESRETTSFGGSVMGLLSNRRQDYEGGLFSLRQAYPDFLRVAPVHATKAMLAVLEAYLDGDRYLEADPNTQGVFVFEGREVPVRADGNANRWAPEEVDALVIADEWEKYIVQMVTDSEREADLRLLFDTCTQHGRDATVWARWLRIGARATGAEARRLMLPLLRSDYVLSSDVTTSAAAECLAGIASELELDERGEIERAVVRVHALGEDDTSRDERTMRFLQALGERGLVSDAARELHVTLRARGTVVEEPHGARPRFTPLEKRTTDDWLRREGVDLDALDNQSIRAACRGLKNMRSAEVCDWTGLLSAAEDLAGHLEATVQTVHPRLVDDAWGELAQSLERVAGIAEAATACAVRERIAQLAVLVADCPCPRPTLGSRNAFHKIPGWGSPHARGDIAGVLTWLGARDARHEVLAAVERLARDEVPSVRFCLLTALPALQSAEPGLMWKLAERALVNERARAVLAQMVACALAPLGGASGTRVARRLAWLLVRLPDGPGSSNVRRLVYELATELYVDEGDVAARALMLEVAQRPSSDDLKAVLHSLRSALVGGAVAPSDAAEDRRRRRAHRLLSLIVRVGTDVLARARSTGARGVDLDEARKVAGVLDVAARQVLHASRAPADAGGDPKAPLDAPVAARLLDESAATIALLADTGVGSTVHSVIETLDGLMPHDPPRAFGLIARAVAAGRQEDYQYDSLAVGLMVRTVTRFLADHRQLVRQDEVTRGHLLDILDVFVRAGWPEAYELTYGLENIFR